MNKWLWLLLFFLSWSAAGFAIFDSKQQQNIITSSKPEQINRIVSLAPNLTEILFSLGLEEKIVGVTQFCNYPSKAATKPNIGTFWQPNIEAVIAARPDLIVVLGFEQQRTIAARLKRIGYNCLMLDIEKADELFTAIERIGTATDTKQKANELLDAMNQKLESLSAQIGNRRKVKVLWVVQREPLRVAGRDTFINEMIELAGGENAIGPTLQVYPPIGAEQVLSCGADVIIEIAMDNSQIDKQKESALQFWNKYKNVPAVANNRIYVINGDTVSRLGPRLYEGIETIAGCLRPELFGD